MLMKFAFVIAVHLLMKPVKLLEVGLSLSRHALPVRIQSANNKILVAFQAPPTPLVQNAVRLFPFYY